jgi:quercetin dioxygenase-like cupin family protein
MGKYPGSLRRLAADTPVVETDRLIQGETCCKQVTCSVLVRLGALGPCQTPVFNRWRRHSEEKERNVSKLESARAETCTVYHLPGRDWYYLLGPLNSGTKNLTFGLAEFPGGTLAAPHVHTAEEEIIYILSSAGAIITEDQEIRLEPGVAVFIPPGLTHQIRVDGAEPLRLVTLFSPPVTPGAYDPKKS